MKFHPQYSFEFNQILNPQFNEKDQVQNFTSLITDKDRFIVLLNLLSKNASYIQERLGFDLPTSVEFYIVRAEKFKSFSMPITIEYSILPEEMILFLLKEIIKTSCPHRFITHEQQESYINSFIDHIAVTGDWKNVDLVKYGKNLHDESKRLFPKYEFKDIDFSVKTLVQYIEDLYNV
jgi:hypothetical protein